MRIPYDDLAGTACQGCGIGDAIEILAEDGPGTYHPGKGVFHVACWAEQLSPLVEWELVPIASDGKWLSGFVYGSKAAAQAAVPAMFADRPSAETIELVRTVGDRHLTVSRYTR